jgi:NADH-quinone oxidoreductase subunit E
MTPTAQDSGAALPRLPEHWRHDEAAVLAMLEDLEQRHGYIPHQVGDEIARLLKVKLERLRRIQEKLESGVRRDVQAHVNRWRGEEGNLIMILHAIQDQYGYVPREVAMELARELDVTLARIYEVLTFFHYFKLHPPGKHNLAVCNGTACYLKGAATLIAELYRQLGVHPGQTTHDREFRLEEVRCVGCCGMSPTLTCDGKTHGHVTPADIARIIAEARGTPAVAANEVPA